MTTFWTIGHGGRSHDELAYLLKRNNIAALVDVRSSRKGVNQPQVAEEALAEGLTERGIHYLTIPDLGGRRPKSRLDPELNAGWENRSFHNYADYVQTPQFDTAIRALEAVGEVGRTAYMCSEIVPWRCHRQIISDVLVTRGHLVGHIIGDSTPGPHRLGTWGATPLVVSGKVTYPGAGK